MDIIRRVLNCCLSVPQSDAAYKLRDGNRDTTYSQKEFEDILIAMACIRKVKINQYGEGRLQLHKDERFRDVVMAYSDVHRKYIRLETQIFGAGRDCGTDEDLIETFTDLAVYCVQAIQIMGRLVDARYRDGSKQRTGSSPEESV